MDGSQPGRIVSGVTRTLILSGYSSNSGGGRTGLIGLLRALPDRPAVVLIDARFTLPFALPPAVRVERIAPSLAGRWRAERLLQRLATPETWVLRLGSVPPLLPSPARVFVFFENRYLLSGTPLAGLTLPRQIQLLVERQLVRRCARGATFVVQSQSVANDLKPLVGDAPIRVAPFHSALGEAAAPDAPQRDLDFIYPSTGEGHKNHRVLIAAWRLLAQENIRPSLLLTVDAASYPELAAEIRNEAAAHRLAIENIGFVPPADLPRHYARAKAMIFPSTMESFGRPLVEAIDFGLPILAPERDYVRDLVDPAQTFDPVSPLSIARAVKRFLGVPAARQPVLDPATFLAALQRSADGA